MSFFGIGTRYFRGFKNYGLRKFRQMNVYRSLISGFKSIRHYRVLGHSIDRRYRFRRYFK